MSAEFELIKHPTQETPLGDISPLADYGSAAIEEAIAIERRSIGPSFALTHLSMQPNIVAQFDITPEQVSTAHMSLPDDDNHIFKRHRSYVQQAEYAENMSIIPHTLNHAVNAIGLHIQEQDPSSALLSAIASANDNPHDISGQQGENWLFVAEALDRCGYQADEAFKRGIDASNWSSIAHEIEISSHLVNLSEIARVAANKGYFVASREAISRLRELDFGDNKALDDSRQSLLAESLVYLGVAEMRHAAEETIS